MFIDSNETDLEIKDVIKKENRSIKRYYAYADSKLKTWFVTSSKNPPKNNLTLLFILGCVDTNERLYYPDVNAPVVGTVLSDIRGRILRVLECEWI